MSADEFQSEFFETVKIKSDGKYDSEIADKAGISRSLYSQMKSGKKRMSVNSMLKIADAVGVTPTMIFNFKATRKRQ